MSEEAEKVVVIQDLSRETGLKAIRWALKGLPLKPGDEITFLGILHQVTNPSMLSPPFKLPICSLGYKMKADNANPLIVEEEFARKSKEYNKNVHDMVIVKHWKDIQIRVEVNVLHGPSAKKVALAAAKDLGATWVILDRQMKKDKRYFMEELPTCKISRLKRDNTMEELRGAKLSGETALERSIAKNISYGEMIPGTPNDSPDRVTAAVELSMSRNVSYGEKGPGTPDDDPPDTGSGVTTTASPLMLQSAEQRITKWQVDESGEPSVKHDSSKLSPALGKSSSAETLMLTATASSSSLSNAEASSSSQTDAKTSPSNHLDAAYTTNTEPEELSPLTMWESQTTMISPMPAYDYDSPYLDHSDYEEFMGLYQTKDVFRNSVCSCGNRRPIGGWSKEFKYAELNEATEGFAPKNFLSEGGFGSVYRGRLKNGMYVAVKQHKHASQQGEKEFKSEVNVLSKARNENLVMLLGSCSEGTNRLLVYEYVCNGSLDQLLSKHSRRSLSWEKRIKIASGAARGLKYLHENNIIHRDMRPNNILVTHDHESLVGDFGLARAHEGNLDHSSETRVVGTLGYLAPEYAESGKVSTKTDVYAFGVVLLQLITGYTTNDKKLKGRSLVGWARPLLKEGNYPGLVDERIAESHDVHHLYWMVRVAEKCLSKDSQKRPSMTTVVRVLDYLANGDQTSSIKVFSPAHSDTISVGESNGSNDDAAAEQVSVFSGGRTSVSSRSQLAGKSSPSASGFDSSTSHPGAQVALRNLVPAAGSKEKSRRGIMRVKSSLRYNDMVD